MLLPNLRRVGAGPDPENVIKIDSNADLAGVVATIHGAVLKFRSNNVEHVHVFDLNGSVTLLFLNDAFSQRYFPRVLGTWSNGLQALLAAGNLRSTRRRA